MLLFLGSVALGQAGGAPKTERVSVSSSGAQGNGFTEEPALSADGRYAVFSSDASNLVRGDTNRASDVFVRDLKTHKTQRVSVSSGGRQANGASISPSISSTGRYVTFLSYATNLAGRDLGGHRDIYLRDRKLHKTIRVSVSSGGRQGTGAFSYGAPVSADGDTVAFVSWSHLAPGDGNSTNPDVFVRHVKKRRTELVSVGLGGRPGNSYSNDPSISADGRFVAFASRSSNLVPHDVGGNYDAFVRDLKTHTTTLASVDSNGRQRKRTTVLPRISADGRFVAFTTLAPLVADDTNGLQDAYVRDLAAGTTQRVSLGPDGNQSSTDHSIARAISAHGEYVAFLNDGRDFLHPDTNGTFYDAFVRDVARHTTTLVGVSSARHQASASVVPTSLSADGRFVGLWSNSADLVPHDTNKHPDAFVRGPLRP